MATNVGFSKENATWINLIVPQGEAFEVPFDLDTNEDVSTWTFSFEAWKLPTQEEVFNFTNPSVQFNYNENVGTLTLSLSELDTADLLPTQLFLYNVVVRRPDANNFILFRGRLVIEDWKSVHA